MEPAAAANHSMPTTPTRGHEVIATPISLRGITETPWRRRGAGVTGGRNEYPKALVISHDTRAQIGLSRTRGPTGDAHLLTVFLTGRHAI